MKKNLHIHWTEFIHLAKGKSELYSKDNCKKIYPGIPGLHYFRTFSLDP